MHFLLPKITIALLVFTHCNNILATRVEKPFAVVSNDSLYAQNSIPSGWRKIDANGKFIFYLPPSMRDTGVSGLEGFHKEYSNGRLHLSFDHEPMDILAYSNRTVAFGKNFQEQNCRSFKQSSFHNRAPIGTTIHAIFATWITTAIDIHVVYNRGRNHGTKSLRRLLRFH